MRFLLALLPLLLVAAPAHAAPLAGVVAAISGAFTAISGSAIGSFLLRTVASFALNALAGALMGKPKQQKTGIGTESTLSGGTVSQTIVFGLYATAGTAVCPPMTHGLRGKKTVDYLTYVIDLADYPIHALRSVFIGETKCTFSTPGNRYGETATANEYTKNAWLRWYDGRQTTADQMLVDVYGRYERPWTADHILKGTAYAVLTFKYREGKTDGMPECLFELEGARLYDPRNDSTVGGSGAQRWDDLATHRFTTNPVVMIYNLMRGLTLADGSIYGLKVPASELPLDRWVAAMNVCDEVVEVRGEFEPRYKAGLEFSVETEPLDVIQTLLTACSGQIADCGGAWNVSVGPAVFPRLHFVDTDIITSSDQDYAPFRGLAETYNGAHASYPNPDVKWAAKDAPPYYNPAWEAEDDDRRLTATLNLNAVSSGYQAQRLMIELVSDNRRWISHTLTLRPGALGILPLDTVSWTSARNGYTAKLFEVMRKVVDPETLCVTLQLRERSPSDYEYDYEALLLPIETPDGPWKPIDGAPEGPPDGEYPDLEPERPTPVDAHLVALHTNAVSESTDGGYSWVRAAAPFDGAEEISALAESMLVRTQTGEAWFATKNTPNAWRRLDLRDVSAQELLQNGDFEAGLSHWTVEAGTPVVSDSMTPPQQGGTEYLRLDGAAELRQGVSIPDAGTLTVEGDVWVADGTATIGVGRLEQVTNIALNPSVSVWHNAPTYVDLPGGLRLKREMTDRGNRQISFAPFFREGSIYQLYWQERVSLVDANDVVQNRPFEIDFTGLLDTVERIQIFGATGVVQDANVDRVNLGGGGVQLTGTGTGGAGNFTVAGVGFIDFRPERRSQSFDGVDIDAQRLRVFDVQVIGSRGAVSSGPTAGWQRLTTQVPIEAPADLIFFVETSGGLSYFDNLSLTLGAPGAANLLALGTDTGARAHYAVSEKAVYRISPSGEVSLLDDGAEPPALLSPPSSARGLAADRGTVVVVGSGGAALSTDGFAAQTALSGDQVYARPAVGVASDGKVKGLPGGDVLQDLGGPAWLEKDSWRSAWVAVRQDGVDGAVVKRGGLGTMTDGPLLPLGGGQNPRIVAANKGRWVAWRAANRDLLWLDPTDNAWRLAFPLAYPVQDMKEVR